MERGARAELCLLGTVRYGKGKESKRKSQEQKYVEYQFPMGKVKLVFLILVKTLIGYQFPMGKVKLMPKAIKREFEKYQFPMGKVKGYFQAFIMYFKKYQFPMGKVKHCLKFLSSSDKVSIPYGKGKEQHFVLCF